MKSLIAAVAAHALTNIRRLSAIIVSVLCATALTACAPIPKDDPSSGSGCDPSWYRLGISVDVIRYLEPAVGKTTGPAQLLESIPIDVIAQGLSPAPGYRGVKYIGTIGAGVAGINPLIFHTTAPYDAVACWPREMPVSFIVRAFITGFEGLQAFDSIQCRFEDLDLMDFLEQEHATRQLAVHDLIPGGKPTAQCVKYYVPGDWSGEPLHTFPPPDES